MSSLPNLDSKIISQTMSKEVLKMSENDDLIIMSSMNSLNYQGNSNDGGAGDGRRIPAKKRQIVYDEISNFERQYIQNINIPNAKTDENGGGGGQDNDDNFHFLMSLLPYLREVPKNRKMAIRLKLQKVFVEEQERKNVSKNNGNGGANNAKKPNEANFNNNILGSPSPFSASCAILLQNLQQQHQNLQQQHQQQQNLQNLQQQNFQQQNLQNVQQQTPRPPPPPYPAYRNDVNKFAPTMPLQNATASTYTPTAFVDLISTQQPNLPQYSAAAVNGLQTGQQQCSYNSTAASDANNGGLGFSTGLMDNNSNISYQSADTRMPQTFTTYLQ